MASFLVSIAVFGACYWATWKYLYPGDHYLSPLLAGCVAVPFWMGCLMFGTGWFLLGLILLGFGSVPAVLMIWAGFQGRRGDRVRGWLHTAGHAIRARAGVSPGHPAQPVARSPACPECGTLLPVDAPQGLCPRCLLQSGLGSKVGPPENGRTDAHTPFAPPTPAELAVHFPQLEILELLGQGGMGAVYKARQPKLDRLVALKVLPPTWNKDPAFAERFLREARALAKLSHPHIVAVHDFGEADGLFYFVMEYVDGANLRQALQAGKLQPAEALQVVPQLCDALQYAHEEGIVHRDIKPENILLDRRGRVKIADFGLAKLMHHTPGVFMLTGSRQVMGTPHYMAPEQMEKPHTVDHRADIYSLGVVFYEMLTGELPLGRFAPPSAKAAVDARLDEVVLRALAKEPAERYQHISEVKTGLEGAAAGRPMASPAPVPGPGPGAERLSVPFSLPPTKRYGKGVYECTSYFGLLRFDGETLALEIEARENRFGPDGIRGQTSLQERAIALADLQSIKLVKEWFSTRLVLRGMRLSVAAGLPGGKRGVLTLRIARKDRALAERFVAQVARALRQDLEPAPATGFFRRKARSLANAAHYWVVDSSVASQTAAPAQPGDAPPRPNRRGRRWLVGLVLGVALCAVVAGGLWLTADFWMPPEPPPMPAARDEPLLSGAHVVYLHLAPGQLEALNRIRQEAFREYVDLEKRHTKLSWNTFGHLHVTIEPFVQELTLLEHRVWAQIDQVLHETQRAEARNWLPLGGALFPFGESRVEFELWRSGGRYRWRLRDVDPPGGQEGPALPRRYQRFWDEAVLNLNKEGTGA